MLGAGCWELGAGVDNGCAGKLMYYGVVISRREYGMIWYGMVW